MDLKFDPENPKYEYIKTMSQAEKALEKLESAQIIAIDVEANSLDPYTGILLLVQIGTDEISYIFDARTLDLANYPRFASLLQDKSKVKLFHNSKFDYKYIKQHLGIECNNIYDTMLAERILLAGRKQKVGLGALCDRYLSPGILDKQLQSSFIDMTKHTPVTEAQLRYAGADTLVLFPLFERQIQKLKQENLLNIAKLEFAVAPVVGNMELNGMFIDKKKWMGIIRNLEIKRDEVAKSFQEAVRPYYGTTQLDLFGGVADAININSQQQLMDLFNNKLKLDMPSTGTQILNDVSHPVVDLLKKYRGYEKLISAFGESLIAKINPKTHRIHPDFLQLQTETGRFACSNPNIQQIPRNTPEAPFRECVNPEPGYKLVISDYSGFEMRILADLSGDENMLKVFTDKLDIHSYTASLMFDKPYSDDFKHKYPDLRQMAKPIGFGLMYGMGAVGLVSRFKLIGEEVTVDQSQDLIDKYFKSYPGVRKFLETVAKKAVIDGYSMTPGGRKRWYEVPSKTDPEYRRKLGKIQREAKNHPIQGTNADAIKYALVFCQERMRKEGIDGKIILTVHDEIGCEVREDQAEDWGRILSEEMVRAGELFLKKVPIRSDPFVGDVWEH
ncbi:hypothetical protein H6802_03940 [Candidatus Nomurabacteria bacterium]|uniref:DNA polymerase I n=1 Tax=candidate division WWE3 bacterium TaxID=2053526 RepID=A0A955E0G1_UNCKA|nr:hypothetical protein [candidate division WWE3 bacterium]MCB9824071.1 hypothetical protein [Candidatus Nomurabacteria bacterium]MCB9826958.1 hypothetical protein [Candidatus Nomurabacteria bacterium]MCB9828012.1 hypothetical protein [Candidatus Nomurabacteria bacterium]HXK52719.1 DNA polymerase [bacterium]